MTADAGECNGRIDRSKVEFELKMGADLRDDGRNGEEIGGSFVIVNGDSDDHSERDLDLGERLENEETRGKEESFVEGGVKNEIFDGGDGDLVEGRSNDGGTEHVNASGLRSDIKVEEGFGGDGVKEDNLVDNELESLNVAEEKQEGEALVVDAEEKKEAEQPEAEVESDSKVELGSEVEMEDAKEPKNVITETSHLEKSDLASQVDDNDLGSSNGVEERQDSEALVVEASILLDEQESEVVIRESDSIVVLGSEVEREDITEPETVITETDHLDISNSASQVDGKVLGSLNEVKEKQDGEAFVVEAATHFDEQESKVVNGESNSILELGSEVEKEDVMELEAVVVEGGCLEELEPASQVEEVKEPVDDEEAERFVVVEGGCLEELEPASQVEEVKEPVDDEEAERLVEAKESREPADVVEGTKSVEDLESAVEAELEQEPRTVVETVDVAKLQLPVEVNMRQEANTGVVEAENLAEVESATEIELKQESNFGVEEIDHLAQAESATEVQLKKDPVAKFEEMGKDEVREGKELEIVTEEIGNQGEIESIFGAEAEQEPEAVSNVADKIEIEETKEPDVVVAEQMTSEDFPHENEEVRMPNIDADAPTDEPSAQLENGNPDCGAEVSEETNSISDVVVTEQMTSEHFPHEDEEARMSNIHADAPTDQPSAQLQNGNTDCAAEVSEETNAICDVTGHLDSLAEVADSLKEELNDEATDINLEGSERPNMCPDSEKELVAEVGFSTDDNDGEVEVNNGETSSSELKTDISSKYIEPSSLSSYNGVDLEPQTRELCPNKDIEIEVKDSTADTESNKDAAVDEMKLDTESGTEGSECMVSFVDGGQLINKDDDDEEPSHEQAHAAEIMQTTQETHVVKRQHVYMIKVPRFIDDELQKKIQHARSIIDEKTRIRDSIGEETRAQVAIVNKFSLDYKAALAKERAARAIYNAKRQEVENLQASIDRINNANSIAEIDEKIRSMAHRQQHETISLKQEKQYIHDINQMMRLREQLSSKKLGQEQIDETLSKRDEIEAKFKNLKKEADSLRTALSAAESSTKSAWNKYMYEEQHLGSLKEKHNEADAVRQEAYLYWRKLKIQLAEKAKHFKMFKADQSAATNYIFSGDNQGLRSHCSRQVERTMDIWNNNSEFREQYVKSNTYSTLRRLGTPDGRSLGPGEEAPILRSYLVDKSPKRDPPPSSNVESPSPVLVSDVKQEILTEPSATKQVARTNQLAKLKSSTKPVIDGSIPAVSNGEELRETKRENEMNKEEEEMAKKAEELARKAEELARKEEELRKEKAAAELKEQLRLEQKAKAREAEERKRRKAEKKAQARAEYRALKEAELKEKKKAKKESKKSGIVDTGTTNGGTKGGGTPIHDINLKGTSQEPETSSIATIRRKSSRPASSMKQYNKVQPPIPLPLRKRGKRKMMAWIWAALVTLLVLVLFFAGNYISFSTSILPYFEF